MDAGRLARRALARWPTVFRVIREGRDWLRWRLRNISDGDYECIRLAPPGGTVVDVGANSGQSAMSFAVLDPTARIVSFEANPGLDRELRRVRRRLGSRFEFHSCALADAAGRMVLHVPKVGSVEITGEASFDAGLASTAGGRVDGITETRSIEVDVRTLDSFHLDPTVVKIDVQGMSVPVLRGMTETLARSRPLLIVESGREDERVAELLEQHGYRRVRWYSNTNPRPLNWVFIP
jgi:FkbM family methyltransferase